MSYNLTFSRSILARFVWKMAVARNIDQIYVPFLLFLFLIVQYWGENTFVPAFSQVASCIIMPTSFLKGCCWFFYFAKVLILRNIFKCVVTFFVTYFSALSMITYHYGQYCLSDLLSQPPLVNVIIIVLMSKSAACSLQKLKLMS